MHPRFQTAFAQLADNLQSALAPVLADAHFPAMLTAEQVSLLKRESGLDEDALAFALLPLAAACARTPLSNFNVGAISRGISGNWYFGGNMEFWARPCSKLFMPSKALSATPGCAVKKGSPPSPSTTRRAATVASL